MPSSPPSLSVILPTYNEPELLVGALQSLSQQDFPPGGVEIIVVDDASPAIDPDHLCAALGPFPLKLIRHEINQGRARARNSGIRASDGEIIIFLDSDMTVRNDFLQAYTSLHQQYSETVFIGNIHFGPQVPDSCLARYIDRRGVHRLKPGEVVPFKCFVTGNSSIGRDPLLRVGLFDEDFTAYGGEDLELGYRLHRHGLTFHFAPQALSFHHQLRSLDQICRLMHTYGQKSLPLLRQKHPELSSLLRLDFLAASRLSPKRLLLEAALSPIVYGPIRRLVQRGMNHYVPDLFFDYLWWYNRTRGYLRACSLARCMPSESG